MLFNVVIVYLPRGVQTLGRVFRWFVGVSRFFSYIYKAIILFLGGKKGYSEPSKFLYMARDKYSRLVNTRCSSVGRMRALGACGRRFESCHLDYKSRIRISVSMPGLQPGEEGSIPLFCTHGSVAQRQSG